MTVSRRKAKGRSNSPPFVALPWGVLDHPDVATLPGNAFKLLVYLSRQYRGKNNGDLTCAFSVLKKDGVFTSEGTLDRAKKELLERGLIVETREGRFINPGGQCALYAITWKPIDECNGKLEVEPTTTAPRSFR